MSYINSIKSFYIIVWVSFKTIFLFAFNAYTYAPSTQYLKEYNNKYSKWVHFVLEILKYL